MAIRNIDIEKFAKAVELDARRALPGLRDSLAQAKRGEFASAYTPEMITRYRAMGRPAGSVKKEAKVGMLVV
jgi:hypothetical protein